MTRPDTLRTFLLPALLFPALLSSPSASTGQSQPTITWHGEVRPRFYAREPVEGSWDRWTSMRARIALNVQPEQGLRLFVQVQDVRFWGGEETARDRSADAVDFHQAFFEVDSLPAVGGLTRAGRQEVGLAEGRLIGAPDWGQAGQTFDGVRWIRPLGPRRLEMVFLKLREDTSPAHDHDADLLASWLALPLGELGEADLIGIHDRGSGPEGNRQNTVGAIWRKAPFPFSFRVQGMYQFGERGGTDVSGYMVAARAGVSIMEDRATFTLWYDHLSGDPDPDDGEVGVFSTLFGARHRFYGRADYFLDIPEDTGGSGLRDAAVKLAFRPSDLLSLNLDIHSFRTAADGALPSARLAEEADAWVKYRFRRYLDLELGYSLTVAGPAMEELGRLEGTGNTGYIMTSLRF
jgi:hypothetical protein